MNKTCGNLEVLLLDTEETYYWIGFLLADGNFSKLNRLKLTLSTLDKNHLERFATYIGHNNVRKEIKEYVTVTVMDKEIVGDIKNKFNIDNKKTYNPPALSIFENLNENLLLSLIIGFIDGDGCIAEKGNSSSLTVKCHSSWLSILDLFCKKINLTSNAKINAQGYAYFTITNYQALHKLKKFVIVSKLSVIDRKWDKIDLRFIPNKEAHERNFKTFVKLFNKFKNMEHFQEDFNKLIYG